MDKFFLWFMFYSFVGWTYETTLYSLRQGRFVNSGMLYGCICPIYGFGALMCIGLFSPGSSSLAIFVGAAVMSCGLEYISSWIIEKLFGARWWDYSDWPFNLNGRISLLSGLAFGFLALLTVKGFHPAIEEITRELPPERLRFLAGALAVILAADMIFSAFRCRKVSESREEVKIVLKLPFDFMPKLMGIKAHVKGFSAVVTQRGSGIIEYITEKLRDMGLIK